MTTTSWSVLALPAAAARHPAIIRPIVDSLHNSGIDVLAATYVAGSQLLFDLLYQGNRPRSRASSDRRLASAFLAVHEYDGPVAVALLGAPSHEVNALKGPSGAGQASAGQLRGSFRLTTHRASFLHVPDLPSPVGDHLFGCGEHPLAATAAGGDRSADFVALAESFAGFPTPTTTWGALRMAVLDRSRAHRDLLAAAGRCACGRLPWRAEVLDMVIEALSGPPIEVTALAALELAHREVVLTATAEELQLVRAWLYTQQSDVGARFSNGRPTNGRG